MKEIFLNKHRKFSIRKLTVGTISVAVGLVFVNDVTGISRVEASLSVEDSNYINQAAVGNGALVEYIRQALETISKAADSTVLPTSIQNLKNKIQSVSTKNESDYTASAWQEFQGKLTTAKSKLDEAEKAYNKAVTIKPNASSYETTINELITSYPEYNTVVIKVREGESTEDAENRHLTNIRRINQVLTAKYAELKETAQLVKTVLPPVGGDIAAQQLEIINSAENILELNKKEATFAQAQHTDLMAGLLEHHKVTLSNLSNLRGNITSEDQAKIKAFLESHNPSAGETDVFQAFSGALGYKFNNDGTITITYTDDGSSDTVPLSIFVKGGSTQTDSPAATYSVTYNYVSGTPDKTLPSNIIAPAVVSDKHTGDVVASPTGQTDVEDTANQGTWHFNGWDKASVTIGTANETVMGTWNFVPTPPAATYTVTYNYVSGTPDKTLPSSITAPAVVSDKHTGDVVASPSGQTDVEDAANQGTWHFNGWDKASVTIGTANETVTGTWNFVPTPPAATYTVTYAYVSGTPDKTLPSGITAPAVVSDKHTGDVVASPTGQTDVEDAANQGTWHFNGWDKASVTVGTSDETVTGTWIFTARPGEKPDTTPGTTTPGENPSTTPGTATPGENPDTTPGIARPGEKPDTTPGTATPGEKPDTTPGTATPGENPSTTPGTTPPGENSSTTPGTATPGENPSTTPGTARPGENPSTTPGTARPGESPSTTPGTATPGENPDTTPGTTTPGEKPSTTPDTATPGEKPGTTPGTAIPGENPDTTPGTTTPGEKPGTTPGTTTPGEKPGTTPGTAIPGEKPDTTPGTTAPGEKTDTTPGTATPGEKPSTTPDTVTPRTTYFYVTSKEDKTLPNSVVEGWSKKDGHWLYQLEDGSHIVNEWKQINGTWYRFDNSGLMQTGWIKENGTWYYLNDSGAMQTGWAKENGTWYYLNDSGAMQTGWVKENGTWYYLNQSGSMETGWFTVSDKWYYANESGALAINTTTPDGYTVNADGEWVE